MKQVPLVLGFDIGGTKLAACLGREEAEEIHILGTRRCSTPRGNWQAALESLAVMGEELLAQEDCQAESLHAIGVSCGGPLDSRSGEVLSPPNLIGWNHVPVTSYFAQRFGVPAFLRNDADACAVAEWKYGAGRGCRNMVFLTFGTGLGAGLILDNRLYSGSNDLAGEIGHVRSPAVDHTAYQPVGYGKCGSFEGFCSGAGIASLGKMMLTEQFQQGKTVSFCAGPEMLESVTAKVIGDAAEAGDELAKEIYRISGRHLGAALAMLADLLDPDRVVVGSVYARSEALLRDAALEVLQRESLPRRRPLELVPAALGEQIGNIAALAVALEGGKQDVC